MSKRFTVVVSGAVDGDGVASSKATNGGATISVAGADVDRSPHAHRA